MLYNWIALQCIKKLSFFQLFIKMLFNLLILVDISIVCQWFLLWCNSSLSFLNELWGSLHVWLKLDLLLTAFCSICTPRSETFHHSLWHRNAVHSHTELRLNTYMNNITLIKSICYVFFHTSSSGVKERQTAESSLWLHSLHLCTFM